MRDYDIDMKDFSSNIIRNLTTLEEQLIASAPEKVVESDGYVTVKGEKHVMNQLKNMIRNVEHRIYICSGTQLLEALKEELTEVRSVGKKVVIITDEPGYALDQATVYLQAGCEPSL